MSPDPSNSGVAPPQPLVRLVCLPHAGGGAAPFYRWRPRLPKWLEILPFCPPGREGRINEPPHDNLPQMGDEVADMLAGLPARPLALLGHSMGALVAFEVARELRRRALPAPFLLIASASRAPHLPPREPLLHHQPAAELLSQLDERYGGLPDEVRTNEAYIQRLLPALRADLRMLETARFCDEPPLDVDLLVLGGSHDPGVDAAALEAWRRHTTGRFSVRLFPGDHFFLFGQTTPPPAVLRLIVERMAAGSGGTTASGAEQMRSAAEEDARG